MLDQDLRVVAASRSFYRTFKVNPEDTEGKLLYELSDGVWDIPKLRSLLEKILPADGAIEAGAIEAYEIERDFPGIGRRTMCLNARKVLYKTGSRANILLGIEDITERLILEGEKDDLLRQKDILLEELQHRVANSLQIIASIIMMKLRAVESEEARRHLQETHQRVMSVAAVQQQLHAAAPGASVELEPYLTKLCEALGQSMIGDNRAIALKVRGDEKTATSRDAESIGLIVTELGHQFHQTCIRRHDQRWADHRCVRCFRNRLEALGHRQRNWHAGRRLCSTKNRAWHRHRQRTR